jgi:1-acyl-sn-glycerol-3-phosphate acyltransferase
MVFRSFMPYDQMGVYKRYLQKELRLILRLVSKIGYGITRFVFLWFFRIWYGLRAHGVDKLPEGGGYILAVNHQSFFDPMLIGCPVPHYITFMARDTLWNSRFFSFTSWLLQCVIPIKRGTADRGALREAVRRIESGWVILMFPEATRTRTGQLNPIKAGPAFIAERCQAPIVPAIMKGAFEVWPKGRMIPSLLPWPFNHLRVIYGEPIYMEDYALYSGKERSARVTRMLEFRMHELFEELK